jgi:acetamidase/formamidase
VDRLTFFSPKFHYTFGPHEPALRIRPGTALRVVCPDSDNELADGTLLPASRRHREENVVEGNPMAGPILVQGAHPGSTLVVRIEKIHLDRRKGQTGLAPAHGTVPSDMLTANAGDGGVEVPRHLYTWDIDVAGSVARLTNALGDRPIAVPLQPFVGCIGVCPADGRAISTLFCGHHGGNMDIPLLRPGTTLFFPVFQAGALLMLGDIHAAQGEGEVIGGAIETSGLVDCTVTVQNTHCPAAPRLADSSRIAAVGIGADVRDAIQRACAGLVDWLSELRMNRWDAYVLASQTMRIVTGGLNLAPYSAAACIPRSVLPPDIAQELA